MNRNITHDIDRLAENCSTFCDRHVLWFILGFSVVYLLLTGLIASQKMLWNDELFTLYIAKLSSLSDIEAAISTGADQQPPSFYFLTHIILKFLGPTELAVRLPEVLGFWLMSLCLFRFISKRLSALYGFAAMMFPLTTIAYEYAYEARPYGMVLGFASLALLCWQEATEGSKRTWGLVGLAASSAAAISSHYYAIFLLVPLGIGEILRSLLRRRIDIPIWISLSCIILPLLFFLPFLQHARTYSSHFWAKPGWGMIPGFYYYLLIPAIGPIVAMLIASSLWPVRDSSSCSFSSHATSQPPWHEIAAACGFVAIPSIAVIVAKFVTGAFIPRYGLAAVIGFSILGAIAVYKLGNGRAFMGVCFSLFIGIWFIAAVVIQLTQQVTTTASWSNTYAFLQSKEDSTLPIVTADLHTFMTLAYYAPRDISARVVYLADPHAAIHYLGQDTIDRGILDLKPWFPVTIEEYHPYLASHKQFLLYARVRREREWLGFYWGGPWELNWILYDLQRPPIRIELRGRNEDALLFLVTTNAP